MNIWLINHYAGSSIHGMEYRPYYMAREWIQLGHEVTIIAASQSHLRNKQPNVTANKTEEVIDGVRYVWLKTPRYSGNGVGRVLNMLAFVAGLFWFYPQIKKQDAPDIVIASSTYPLDILPADYIARKNNAKLIFEVHDLWPLSPMELGGMSKWHPFIMVMQLAENYAYRKANTVISMLPKACDHMQEHGMATEKFGYIPNGLNVGEWDAKSENLPAEHTRLFESLHPPGTFIIIYAGAHGIANALDTLIDAMERLKDEKIVAVFVGQGPEKERLQQSAYDRQLSNVMFLPAVAKKIVPNILENADALYIGWQHQNLYRFGISPNKLFDYMMAGKPVIHSVRAGNDIVAEAGCGISVPPEDPQAIAEAILTMQSMSAEERAAMGARGRAYVIKNHDYQVLAKKFIDSL